MESSRDSKSLIGKGVHSSSFGKDELVSSIMSKLVTTKGHKSSAQSVTTLPTQNELQPIMRDTIQRAMDADNAFEVLPDLEMVAQIAISSILSSKDLITTTLIYESKADLPFELRNELVKIISTHFDDEYRLPSYLYDILYEVMFKSGAYPAVIVPESSVDLLIRSGREGVAAETIQTKLKDSFGYKGVLGSTNEPARTTGIGLEGLLEMPAPLTKDNATIDVGDDTFGSLHLTDNLDMLKLPSVKRGLAKSRISSTYNTAWAAVAKENRDITSNIGRSSKETAAGTDPNSYDNSIYSDAPYTQRPIEEMPNATFAQRPNIGHPLVQHLPAESVIPVHVPGDFKMHVGYLVLLDKLGNPVSRHDMMNTTQAWSWISGDASSKMLNEAAQGLGYGKESTQKWTVAKLTEAYSDLVDRKLKNALANGIYGDSVTLTRPQEVYRIMMARALSKKQTQVLYVPVEQMSYFAFDYTDTGVGRSLTDKNKIVTAGRAALMFATLQSSVLNATRNMQYTIELSPEDREPESTIDSVQQRIMQSYGGRIPFTGSIDDMQAYFTNAGISFNVEGNDYYPSTKISVTDNTPDYKTPDRDVDEDMAKRNYRGFGVDPDLILTPGNIEFATQVLSKDLIATKQTCQRQEKFAPLITHFCRTYVTSSGTLMSELAKAIIAHYEAGERKLKEGELGHYLNEFINNISVSLPPPDMSLLSSQMDAYDVESKAIDEMVEVFVDEDFLMEAGFEGDLRACKAMVSNYLKRSWFRKNGVMPDLLSMMDDQEKRQEYVKSLADDNVNIVTFLSQALKRTRGRVETVSRNIDVGDGEEDSTIDGGGEDDFGGGEDDFGGDTTGDEDTTGGEDSATDDDVGGEDDIDLNKL